MNKTYRFLAIVLTAVTFLTITALSESNAKSSATAKPAYEPEPYGPKDEYDRLDGMGRSKAKVDVIEWAGNLEVHITPKGLISGLAVKLDKKDKNKPVMVIGYRFNSNSKRQLIRRAILGIPMREGFTVYKDESADDYDKFMISNHTLQGVVAYKTDSELLDLFPAGHPQSKYTQTLANNQDKQPQSRVPAAKENDEPAAEDKQESHDEDTGSIRFKNF